MTATLAKPREETGPPPDRLRLLPRRRPAPTPPRRAFVRRLAVSAFLHAALLGGIALWVHEPVTTFHGPGTSLQILHADDLPPDPLEEVETMDVPELEEVPVFATTEPPVERPLEEREIEDPDAAFLPALDPGPAEADLALSDISVRVVEARTRRAAPPPPPPPRARPPTVPVVARPAPPPPPRPRAAGGSRGGRLTPVQMPRIYPEAARRMGLEGRAVVLVTIGADGGILDARLVASTGHPILDDAALTSARAWRFRPPGETRRLRIPFLYDLR